MFEEVFKVCDQYIPDIDKHSVFFSCFWFGYGCCYAIGYRHTGSISIFLKTFFKLANMHKAYHWLSF